MAFVGTIEEHKAARAAWEKYAQPGVTLDQFKEWWFAKKRDGTDVRMH